MVAATLASSEVPTRSFRSSSDHVVGTGTSTGNSLTYSSHGQWASEGTDSVAMSREWIKRVARQVIIFSLVVYHG